jgi:hypothetical protein
MTMLGTCKLAVLGPGDVDPLHDEIGDRAEDVIGIVNAEDDQPHDHQHKPAQPVDGLWGVFFHRVIFLSISIAIRLKNMLLNRHMSSFSPYYRVGGFLKNLKEARVWPGTRSSQSESGERRSHPSAYRLASGHKSSSRI